MSFKTDSRAEPWARDYEPQMEGSTSRWDTRAAETIRQLRSSMEECLNLCLEVDQEPTVLSPLTQLRRTIRDIDACLDASHSRTDPAELRWAMRLRGVHDRAREGAMDASENIHSDSLEDEQHGMEPHPDRHPTPTEETETDSSSETSSTATEDIETQRPRAPQNSPNPLFTTSPRSTHNGPNTPALRFPVPLDQMGDEELCRIGEQLTQTDTPVHNSHSPGPDPGEAPEGWMGGEDITSRHQPPRRPRHDTPSHARWRNSYVEVWRLTDGEWRFVERAAVPDLT